MDDMITNGRALDEIISKSRDISRAWEKYFIKELPDYAFAYEEGEGDRYVRTEYIIKAEQQVKDKYIEALENSGNIDYPPLN